MSRHEYVKCIADNHVDHAGTAWCGREIGQFEFSFTGIDHAAFNGRREGRFVACIECTTAIIAALSNGQEE